MFSEKCHEEVYHQNETDKSVTTDLDQGGRTTLFTEYAVLDSRDDDDEEAELEFSDEFTAKVEFWRGAVDSSSTKDAVNTFAVLHTYLTVLEGEFCFRRSRRK